MRKTELSPIIAGTMNWGVWDKNLTTIEMENQIQICLENKISSFDHADIYGAYTTELEFGKAFANSKIPREKLQFISKCGIQLVAETRKTTVKHYNYSKEYLIWSVENSLKNLKTDYLDVLLLHRPSPLIQADEIAEAVLKLQETGKIIDFGLSNFTASQSELIRQKIKIAYNQIQFSAIHFKPMLDGSFDYMQAHDIRPMCWNPLGTVFSTDSAQTQRLKKTLAILVSKYNLESATILISWLLQHPAKIIPVIGTVTAVRIQEIQKATSLQLDLEDWFAIWTESMGEKVP